MQLLKKMGLMMMSVLLINTAFAQETTVEVGGAPMYPTKNIVENAINSKDHTTLVAAVKAAGLVETLEGLDLSYPKVDGAKRKELAAAKKLLLKK